MSIVVGGNMLGYFFEAKSVLWRKLLFSFAVLTQNLKFHQAVPMY